jgi:hypothetical protein
MALHHKMPQSSGSQPWKTKTFIYLLFNVNQEMRLKTEEVVKFVFLQEIVFLVEIVRYSSKRNDICRLRLTNKETKLVAWLHHQRNLAIHVTIPFHDD